MEPLRSSVVVARTRGGATAQFLAKARNAGIGTNAYTHACLVEEEQRQLGRGGDAFCRLLARLCTLRCRVVREAGGDAHHLAS